MSGFAAIVEREGPSDKCATLSTMANFLRLWGPDEQNVVVHDQVGFCHALLRTKPEDESEHQPFTFDSKAWIVADCRIDARRELLDRLSDERIIPTSPDSALILAAYLQWGEACVENLIGDFAFVIWDASKQALFGARDHFGVKPLFYSNTKSCFVASNSLECVRLHPQVSDDIDDSAIGDFLLFDYNQNLSSTSYLAIRRVPPAHTFTWRDGDMTVHRYWSVPTEIEGRWHTRNPSEVLEGLRDCMQGAVRDRVRGGRVAVLFSGGLDSNVVTAATKSVLDDPDKIKAFTGVYDRLIPDDERHYAGLAASAMGIPIEFQELDEYRLFEGWDDPEHRMPEPDSWPLEKIVRDQFCDISKHARVVLTGVGGDGVMRVSPHYAFSLLRRFGWLRLGGDVATYVRLSHRLPNVGFRSGIRRLLRRSSEPPPLPEWLNPDFVAKCDLLERWCEFHREPPVLHPTRPEAYWQLLAPVWQWLLEGQSPAWTGAAVDARHPFFDVRVVRFLLSLRPIPWCADKELLRLYLKGVLPEQVRMRPKTPLRANPVWQLVQADVKGVLEFAPAEEIDRYVNRKALQTPDTIAHPAASYSIWLPKCLNYWLRRHRNLRYKLVGGENDRNG